MAFGDQLAKAREANGLSQEDLAKKLGRDQSTVAKWETNERQPRAMDHLIGQLVGLLGFPKDFYFGSENAPDAQPGGEVHKKGLPGSTGGDPETGEDDANVNEAFINAARGSTGHDLEGNRPFMNSQRAQFALDCLMGLGPTKARQVFNEYLRRTDAEEKRAKHPLTGA